jgi:hypothetical protein
MLKDNVDECIIQNEFTKEAVDYLNSFPIFGKVEDGYIYNDFYYVLKNEMYESRPILDYIDRTDHSPWDRVQPGTRPRFNVTRNPMTLDEAERLMDDILPLWHEYCQRHHDDLPPELLEMPEYTRHSLDTFDDDDMLDI